MYPVLNAVGSVVPNTATPLAAETLSAAVAVHGEYLVMRKCRIRRLMFMVTTLVAADTTAPVVTFRKRLAAAATSGQSTIGTLTIPDATPVGTIVYKDVEPVELEAGQVIALDHTTQAADGSSAAGAGFYGFELEDSPDQPSEQAAMLESA